jgi:thymidine kinase
VLTIINGPMFSGKTEELLRIYNRHKIAKRSCALYKPDVDRRHEVSDGFTEWEVCSRSGIKGDCAIISSDDSIEFTPGIETIFIDEMWMLPIPVLGKIVASGIDIYGTTLNAFASGDVVETTAWLLTNADDIKFLRNICIECGSEGSRTGKRGSSGGPNLSIAGDDVYYASCTPCWNKVNMR